ncbi:MAG: hypothetical protein JWM28_3611 [Chitinophagaceae bacterium]|nr:hypothetical protein [Chitinophagaceae bacterium]
MLNKLVIIVCLFYLYGCKISESNFLGKYIDKDRGDTLKLMSGNTYEFEEKLKNGEHGWNTGNWTIAKKRISFFNTNPLPVVGYKLRVNKIGVSQYPLQLIIHIDPSKKNIAFTEVGLLDKGIRINDEADIVTNRIIVKTIDFDSLVVKIPYFPMIAFNKNKLDINGIYEVIIYPAERLYELDKFAYKYQNGCLINRTAQIRYRKIADK